MNNAAKTQLAEKVKEWCHQKDEPCTALNVINSLDENGILRIKNIDTAFFNIDHPERLFEIMSLTFTRYEELGSVEADFLLFPVIDGGFNMNYVRYEGDNYGFERSGIANIFWNDSFHISDDDLKELIELNPFIISILEAVYQYWKMNGENSKGHESIYLELVPVSKKKSANKSFKPTSKGRGRKMVANYQAKLPRPLEAA